MTIKAKIFILAVFAFCILSVFWGLSRGTRKIFPPDESRLKNLVQKNPLDPEAYYNLSKFYLDKEPPKAETVLKHALKINKFELKYILTLADLLKNMGRYNEALDYYNDALSTQPNIGSVWTSDIYLSLADIYLAKNNEDKFFSHIDEARKSYKDNWKTNLLMFRYELGKDTRKAFQYYSKAWESVKASRAKAPQHLRYFEDETHLAAKELLERSDFEGFRALYEKYVFLSNEYEGLLADLNDRFKKFPELRRKIWGDKISFKLFDAGTNDGPLLKNLSKGCSMESVKQHIESGNPAFEKIDVKYSSSPSYIDLWFIPLNIQIKSPKTSVSITLSSNSPIEGKQITVELLNDLYYTNGELQKEGNLYVLTAGNILSYVEKYLPLMEKDYTIKLTKLGINTVCRNGNYGISKMEIYLED